MEKLTERQRLRLNRGKLQTNIYRLNKINHSRALMNSLHGKLEYADKLLKK